MNLVIGLCTLPAIEGLGGGSEDADKKKGVAILFLIFAGIAALATFFVATSIPETKGKSLEELQRQLAASSDKRPSDFQPLAATQPYSESVQQV